MARSKGNDTELILQAWSQTSNETLYWNKMTNDKSSEIGNQLLTITAISIPLIGAIISGKSHIDHISATVISFGLFFLFTSIIAGFIQIFEDIGFYREYMNYNAYRSIALYNNLNTSLKDALYQADQASDSNTLKRTSKNTYLIIQEIFLSLGFISIIGIIITMAFSGNTN